MKTLIVSVGLLFSCALSAQPYVEGGKTRHRFAQLTVGMDVRHFPSAGSQTTIITSGPSDKRMLSPETELRLVIGGTHFWGHADFYIAFPIVSLGNSGFSTGAETGARFFPWRIEHKKLRPYLGAAWLTTAYEQGKGSIQKRNKFPVVAGLTYCTNRTCSLTFRIGAP